MSQTAYDITRSYYKASHLAITKLCRRERKHKRNYQGRLQNPKNQVTSDNHLLKISEKISKNYTQATTLALPLVEKPLKLSRFAKYQSLYIYYIMFW